MLLGWKPSASDYWVVAPDQWVRLDNNGYTRFQINACAFEVGQHLAWTTAAKHSYGGGLETGVPSFEAARRAERYFKKNGLRKEAQALEEIIVGISPSCTSGR